MLKETIEYTDYNGVVRKEDFRFNLTQAEVVEMEMTEEGGMVAMIQRIVDAKDSKAIMKTFKDLVLKAYGVTSADGRRFIKSDELREEFSQTEAYNILFMKLATDSDVAAAFVNGILPKGEAAKPAVAPVR